MTYELNKLIQFNNLRGIQIMIKKYNEVELYKLLHAQANLVKQTKHEVLDKLFKTGVAGPDDINIFSLLGILLDLQNLAVEFL